MGAQCKICGVPKIIGKTHAWRDGCIVDKASGLADLCIYEAYNHNTFVDEMAKQLGLPLEAIIYNASVHASRNVIQDMLEPHPMLGKLAFSAPLYRRAERLICDIFKAIGTGDIDICEHSRCGHAKAFITSPFNLMQCIAITAGALQAVDGTHYTYSIVREGDLTEVDYLPSKGDAGDEEAYERLSSAELTPRKSSRPLSFTPCPKCGVPRELGEALSFDLLRGVIRKKEGGYRVILGGIASFNAMFREFERELGDTINAISSRIEMASTRKNLMDVERDGRPWEENELRDYLALIGIGLLREMEQDGDKLTVSMDNVYVPPLVAGRLAGIWESWHQQDCDCDFSIEDNNLTMTIQPKA